MSQYYVIEGSAADLTTKVTAYLELGWALHGALTSSAHAGKYAQAMIKIPRVEPAETGEDETDFAVMIGEADDPKKKGATVPEDEPSRRSFPRPMNEHVDEQKKVSFKNVARIPRRNESQIVLSEPECLSKPTAPGNRRMFNRKPELVQR